MVTSFRSCAPSYFKHFYIPNYDKWNNLILCWAGTAGFYYCVFGVRNRYKYNSSSGFYNFNLFLYQGWVGPSLIIIACFPKLVFPRIIINGLPCIKNRLGSRSKLLTSYLHPSEIRGYSTISPTPPKAFKRYNLIKYYPNLQFKSQMIKENKKLSGVYIIINNNTNKIYIGSSLDLGRRLSVYFTNSFLANNETMIISKALVKHSH